MKEKILYENNFYEDEDEIDLKELVFVLFRRWKLIVLLGIIGGIIGISFTVTRPNVYKAEMLMIVSKGGDFSANSLNEGELSVNRKLAATYTEIAKNSVILKNIIKKHNLNITLKELQNNVTIAPVGNTELLRLTYKNSDPILATAVASEIGAEFMLKVRTVMNFQNIKVVESTEVTNEMLSLKKVAVASFVFSIIIGCIIAFISELFFGKLHKVKDIEGILEAPIIGAIPILNNLSVDGGENGK